ncbi:MAG: hypothetical protein AAGD28_16860, partial [Bacteroidota bacterium]
SDPFFSSGDIGPFVRIFFMVIDSLLPIVIQDVSVPIASKCRYILYNNGQEEIYDHKKDPYEWTNIAARKKGIRKAFRKEIQARLKPYKLKGMQKLQLP